MEQVKKTITIKCGTYKHYRGNKYKVLYMAKHSESEEDMVVYQQLYGDFSLWVRPAVMFEELVEHHGIQVPRFQFIE